MSNDVLQAIQEFLSEMDKLAEIDREIEQLEQIQEGLNESQ